MKILETIHGKRLWFVVIVLRDKTNFVIYAYSYEI